MALLAPEKWVPENVFHVLDVVVREVDSTEETGQVLTEVIYDGQLKAFVEMVD